MRAYTLAKEIGEELAQLPAVEAGRCWFCRKALKRGQRVNRHHVIARRYAKKAKAHVIVAKAHAFCHALWHAIYDYSSSRKWRNYRSDMQALSYGYAIFAEAEWLERIETPPPLQSEFWQLYHPLRAPHPQLGTQRAA